jgi:hypothetical protein
MHYFNDFLKNPNRPSIWSILLDRENFSLSNCVFSFFSKKWLFRKIIDTNWPIKSQIRLKFDIDSFFFVALIVDYYKGRGSMIYVHLWAGILPLTPSSHGTPKEWTHTLKPLEFLHLLIYYSKSKKLGRVFSRDHINCDKSITHSKIIQLLKCVFI